jgi:adenylate kinase
MLRALFLAPPGAGKGTQGPRLADAHGVTYLSTGDMLRDHVARETPLGQAASRLMAAGELVPDDVVVGMLLDRMTNPTPLTGFVLDGFPRTIDQAKAAYDWGRDRGAGFQAVLYLVVPRDELVRRVAERSKVSGRADDGVDTFQHRLDVYDELTKPLLDYYRERGILIEIDGTGTMDQVAERIERALASITID